MSNAFQRDTEKLIEKLIRQGFRIRNGTHYVIYPPDPTKRCFTIAKSTDEHRAYKNVLAECRRAGYREESL